jgi:ribonuclease BN (tRNA processing enzyme)
LKRALNNLFKAPNFPVRLADLNARISLKEMFAGTFKLGSIVVDAFDVNHPNGAFGLKFTFPGGKSAVFISDNGPEPDNRYLIDKISGADVLIHDAQYLPEEYLHRYKFGHSPFNYILDLARETDVKSAILFHHDPSRTDREVADIEASACRLARRIGLKARIAAAREGMIIEL